jgi:excinuclease UvrABC nuclease subunit
MSTESLVWHEFSTFSEARQFGFELNKPCVYMVLDNQGKVLYVGKSIHGFGYRYWGHEGMIQALMEGSGKRIRITNVDKANLGAIELKLISDLQPSYNRAGKNNAQLY